MNQHISSVDTGNELKIDFLRSLLIHETDSVVAVNIRKENYHNRLNGLFFEKVI